VIREGPVFVTKTGDHTTYEETRWCLEHPHLTPPFGCTAPPDSYHPDDPTRGGKR
jgi:hypothetical protein